MLCNALKPRKGKERLMWNGWEDEKERGKDVERQCTEAGGTGTA